MSNEKKTQIPANVNFRLRKYTPPTRKQRDAALAKLVFEGLSVADFARKHELSYGIVYQVLSGRKKGRRGEAHRAAVLLGLKDGAIVPEISQETADV